MSTLIRYRNLLLGLVGVAALLLKRFLAEFLGDFALSYVGNLSASFAVYFIITIAAIPKLTRVMVVMLALLVVEGFEMTNGYGIMTNVYDPCDYLANATGIGLAFCIDIGSSRLLQAKDGCA